METIIEKQTIAFQEGGVNWRYYVTVKNGNTWEWAFFKHDISLESLDIAISQMESKVLNAPKHKLLTPAPDFDGHSHFR